MSKELNCMNCCIGDFKHSLCDCNNGMCKEYKKVGRAEDFENEVLNRTKLKTEWIPVSERLPEEREWIGTKKFGTTKSDTILMTFDVDGTRFVKPLSLQNGKLSRPDEQTMDAFYKGCWKMLAWMPLPEPYREDGEEE